MINIYHEGLCSKELKNKVGICKGSLANPDELYMSVYKIVGEYLDSKGIGFPYLRNWTNEKGHMIIDYGSHAKFIVLEEVKDGST